MPPDGQNTTRICNKKKQPGIAACAKLNFLFNFFLSFFLSLFLAQLNFDEHFLDVFINFYCFFVIETVVYWTSLEKC